MRLLNRCFSRSRTAPRGYEKVHLYFHAMRSAQLVSSIIVGSIMAYFMKELVKDHYTLPWTFLFLFIVSFMTIASLLVTIAIHALTGLTPRLSLILNTGLALVWIPSVSSLNYFNWTTLTHWCNMSNWRDGDGVMVCREYKALYAFAIIGVVSTVAAVALDWRIHQLSVKSGRHVPLADLDDKSHPVNQAVYGEDDLPRFAAPESRGLTDDHAENGVTSNQFGYDTGYHGGHAERVFGSDKY